MYDMLMHSKYPPSSPCPPPPRTSPGCHQLADGFPVLKNMAGFVFASIRLDCNLYQSALFYCTSEAIETRGTRSEGRRARWTQCMRVGEHFLVVLTAVSRDDREVNPLKTKRIFYIRAQCVPRCKHSPLRL
jgi:hypothetical protein